MKKSGGVEELWRSVWLVKEEEERREEKRNGNSLIPPFCRVAAHLLYIIFFFTPQFQLFFFVKRCAEFAIKGYSWCVAARGLKDGMRASLLEGFKPKHAPLLPFLPFHTFDTSLSFLHLTLSIGDKKRHNHDHTTHTPHTPLMTMDMDRDMSKYASLLQTAKAEPTWETSR